MDSTSPYERLIKRFDHFDPEFEAHFFEVANEFRERCPVVHSDAYGGYWTFSRFADVRNGFGDEAHFTTVPTTTIPVNPAAVPLIPLQCEPDVHRDFRRILDPYFRLNAVGRHEEGMRRITTELIDDFIERGRCEFVREFAQRLPGAAIYRLFMGFPDEELEEAYHWTLAITHALGTPEAPLIYEHFLRLIARLVARRRAEPARGDVIDALLQARVLGRAMTDDEVSRTILQLIAAGLDTTRRALGNIVVNLVRHPELRQRLEADPAAIPAAIEEFLRFEAPAAGLVRTAAADVEVGGQEVRAGERVMLLVAAANRDPDEFEAPDELRIDRVRNRHLSFGYGAHYCIGVHLARLELRVGIEELLARVHDLRIVQDEIPYDLGVQRGPKELHLEFTPGPRRGTATTARAQK